MINTGKINAAIINTKGHTPVLVASTLSVGSTVKYTCVLTGSPDLTLKIASAQIRKKSGAQTFASVSVPNGLAHITDIQARAAGDLVITRTQTALNGTITSGEIVRVAVDRIDLGSGPSSSTVIIQGHKNITNTTPTIRPLVNASQYNLNDGLRRVRAQVDHTISGADIAQYDGKTFVISDVAINLRPDGGTMDVSEAEA